MTPPTGPRRDGQRSADHRRDVLLPYIDRSALPSRHHGRCLTFSLAARMAAYARPSSSQQRIGQRAPAVTLT